MPLENFIQKYFRRRDEKEREHEAKQCNLQWNAKWNRTRKQPTTVLFGGKMGVSGSTARSRERERKRESEIERERKKGEIGGTDENGWLKWVHKINGCSDESKIRVQRRRKRASGNWLRYKHAKVTIPCYKAISVWQKWKCYVRFTQPTRSELVFCLICRIFAVYVLRSVQCCTRKSCICSIIELLCDIVACFLCSMSEQVGVCAVACFYMCRNGIFPKASVVDERVWF